MTKDKNKKNKGNRLLKFIILIVFIIVIWKYAPIVSDIFGDDPYTGEDVSITVDSGDTINEIAQKLEDAKVVDSKWSVIGKYKLNSSDYGTIQYFEQPVVVEKGMTVDDILKKLTKITPAPVVSVVIPEGFSVDMIALRMSNHDLCTVDEFIEAVKDVSRYDYEFIKHIPDGNYKYKLEGFLFPDTYRFELDTSATEIVNKMLGNFAEVYDENVGGSYENIFKVVTIASMVEREAQLQSERATIAGVIANRIAKGMLLQIDATAVYAKSNGLYDIENVTGETVSVDSPYNTYKYIGLPPGPICNPGISSMIAAKNPQSHTYLYYHTDTTKGDGSHIFTETYDQHRATMN